MISLAYLVYAILLILSLAFMYYKDDIIKWSIIAYKTIPRDIRGLSCLLRYRYRLWRFKKANGTIAGLFFSRSLRKWPDNIAFIYENSQWTYTDVANYANAVALYFYENQMDSKENSGSPEIKVGDVVALFMESKPEFICTWLGLSRIGVKCALINYNLRNETLLNSINALPIKAVIYGVELEDALKEILPKLDPSIKLFATSNSWRTTPEEESKVGKANPLRQPIDESFKVGSPLPDKAIYKAKTRHEILFYIYTSGTTGMPKAAIVSHVKYLYLTYLVSRTLKIRQDDRIYTALPLYHTAGGIVGVGQSLLLGNTVVIKKKFSASKFWEECIKYECTVAQYIGEICRYLLNQPPKPTDRQHKVRMMYGNGLRIQIWKEFVERFNIKEIGEFYGATESNANMVNMDNTFGAVGFNSPIFPGFLPITLIKVNSETGVPLRNSNGLCILCKPGEPGELVGKIIKSDPVKSFQGYSDREATRKKVVTNVFRKGDAAFLTGDILVQDEFGYFYFKDRTGDTYRWKGENVSTLEVESVISGKLDNKDVIVYGVTIPDIDGKAGMAAILDPENSLDVEKLAKDLTKSLPAYSRPVFIRILKKMDLTSTFKPKKNELVAQGFDPGKVEGDVLYYLDPKGSSYTILTPSVYEEIIGHKIRL